MCVYYVFCELVCPVSQFSKFVMHAVWCTAPLPSFDSVIFAFKSVLLFVLFNHSGGFENVNES